MNNTEFIKRAVQGFACSSITMVTRWWVRRPFWVRLLIISVLYLVFVDGLWFRPANPFQQ